MAASFRRPAAALVVVALFLTVIGACTGAGDQPSAPASNPASAAPSAASSAAEPSAPLAFPVTLIDDEGTDVAIPEEPQRIVALQPAITDTLFAIDAGDRVVGRVEDIFEVTAEAQDVPVVATYQGVDIEKVVGLEPDLVIAGGKGGNPPEDVARLRSLGIPVLVVYAESVEGVLADIELIGAAVGESAEAETLMSDMAQDIADIEAATADLPRPRVFYEIDATTDIYGPAEGSFLAEMIELAGGQPITTGSTEFVPIPLETLVTADPEVIVLGDAAYRVTADAVAKRPGWNVMTAVKDGAIRPAQDVLITRPGPRIAAGLADLARAIHPDIVLPD